MTIDYGKRIKPSLLCILVFLLCSMYIPALADGFTVDHVTISSNPTDGTTYNGDRNIASDTKRIKTEIWDPGKVPSLITYTISSYAKGPGTLTLYLGLGARTLVVGSWTSVPH